MAATAVLLVSAVGDALAQSAAPKAADVAPAVSNPLPNGAAAPQPATTPVTPADRYRARAREAIAPLVGQLVSEADKAAIKAAAVAVGRSDLIGFAEQRSKITDPVGRKLVDWYRLQRGFGAPEEASAFLRANPEWPDEDTIRRRMEEALFTRPASAEAVIALFAKAPPVFGPGRAALAAAHLARGETEPARRLAVTAWRGDQIPDAIEGAFLERFGKLLVEADHKWRLDVILGDDRRWASERRGRAADARRIVPLLSAPEQARAKARIAVYLRDKAGAKLLRAVLSGKAEPAIESAPKPEARKAPGKTAALSDQAPAKAVAPGTVKSAVEDWGLALQHVQLLRREKRRAEAAAIAVKAPVDPARNASLDGWWAERHALALELIADGKMKAAYDLVRDAGPLSVNPAKDQAFLAGHIALRHLRDRPAAIRHFTAMRKAADGPLSRSKAEYWLARAHVENGDGDAAAEHYRRGATFIDTFDGQLARLKAYPASRTLPVPLPDAITEADIGRFLARDAVAAARLAAVSGFTRRNAMTFFARLSHRLTSEAELAMLAELARSLGDTQIAVRLGKAAVARGRKLYLYAYPIDALPAYTPLRPSPERAMLLAIARQETEFNEAIVSGAGARGILQVMPVTARHVCRDYRVPCNIPRLLSDPSYNAQLAAAYIADRTDEFAGSYILTLTGYNAGPGRTREWLRKLGDPRVANVDPLDWIYRIPFEETRGYVQKVLANVQIYRSLLGEEKPLRLDLDLARAKAGRRSSDAAGAGDRSGG